VDGPKILFVVNTADFFRSHRMPLAEEARRRGWQVLIGCAPDSGEATLRAAGWVVRTLPLSRSGFNPVVEWRTYRALRTLYLAERPALAHHVTIKPVIYGSWAALRSRVPAVVNSVPGLGFVFTVRGLRGRLRRAVVNLLYRTVLFHPNVRFIFQNRDDQEGFLRHTHMRRASTYLIRGSGVDLARFAPRPEPSGAITFILVARMLRDKGVVEFVAAARIAAAAHADWRFLLVGDVDPGNPSSLTRGQLAAWHAEGVVEWLGHRDDIAELLGSAHIVCLPSYREGLPKTLIEAAACGRPAISSDVPGCREVVRDGVTGLLVPPRVVEPLAAAMMRLGEDAALRARMGRATRERAAALFAIEDVVKDTFLVYESALAAS
jgi:glycosyltransferase involved in cell wall biosynthesis